MFEPCSRVLFVCKSTSHPFALTTHSNTDTSETCSVHTFTRTRSKRGFERMSSVMRIEMRNMRNRQLHRILRQGLIRRRDSLKIFGTTRQTCFDLFSLKQYECTCHSSSTWIAKHETVSFGSTSKRAFNIPLVHSLTE